MKKKFILASILISSTLVHAGEFREIKNQIEDKLDALVKENSTIRFKEFCDAKGIEAVINKIQKQNKGIHKRSINSGVDNDYISNFIFDFVGWEPEFCKSFKSSNCKEALGDLLSPLSEVQSSHKYMVYLDGDDNSRDYKKIYILVGEARNKNFAELTLTIHDEP